MQYKNTTKSLSEIGKELGVATILEGSVRRSGNRVRIVAQLIDTETDKHLWTDTYDRNLDDIFAIQSDVAKKIAAALEASLTPEEEKRIHKKPTENLEAYDYYLKGNVIYSIVRSGAVREAIKMYENGILYSDRPHPVSWCRHTLYLNPCVSLRIVFLTLRKDTQGTSCLYSA